MSELQPPLLPIRGRNGRFTGDLPDDVVRDIARRLQAGEGYRDISQAIGLRRGTGPRKCAEIARALGMPVEKNRTTAFWDEVQRRAEAGETLGEISTALKRPEGSVSYVLRRLGLSARRLSISDDEHREIVRRLMAGETTWSVARAVGCEQADVMRRRKKIAHLIKEDGPPCECGMPNRHRGHCALPDEQVQQIRQRLIEGATIEQIAREIGQSPQTIRRRYASPIIAELSASGVRCRCGKDLGHSYSCVASSERRRVLFSPAQYEIARRMSLEGKAILAIAEEAGLGEWTARRLCKEVRDEMAREGSKCACGRPINHSQSCSHRLRLRGTSPVYRAVGMDAPKPPKVADQYPVLRRPMAIPKGPLDREVYRRFRLKQTARRISDELALPRAAVAALIAYWRERSRYKKKFCDCGQLEGHVGGCSATNPTAIGKRLLARIETLITAGGTLQQVADTLDLSVQAVSRHSLAVRERMFSEGRTCGCKRIIGHPGCCSATWDAQDRPRGRSALPQDLERKATDGLVRGWSIAAVAKATGISAHAATALRRSLSKDLLAKRAAAISARLKVSRTSGADILEKVKRAVPDRLERALRDDITSEIFVAVIEGRIDEDQIKAAARSFIARGVAEWQSRYGPRSLDEKLGQDGSLTLGDLIEDQTTTAQIDEIFLGENEA